ADAGSRFTQSDLDQVVAQLEREREQIERELGEAQKRRSDALRALEAAREQARQAKERGNAPPGETERALELVSLREAQLEAADTGTRVLRLMLEGGNVERTMWEVRFAAYDSRSVKTLSDSERRLGAFTRRLD